MLTVKPLTANQDKHNWVKTEPTLFAWWLDRRRGVHEDQQTACRQVVPTCLLDSVCIMVMRAHLVSGLSTSPDDVDIPVCHQCSQAWHILSICIRTLIYERQARRFAACMHTCLSRLQEWTIHKSATCCHMLPHTYHPVAQWCLFLYGTSIPLIYKPTFMHACSMLWLSRPFGIDVLMWLLYSQQTDSLACMLAGVQYTGHERPVMSLCMLQSHSACTVASCDESGAIHLWSTATGMQLAVFRETTGMTSSGAGMVHAATALPTHPQGMAWTRAMLRGSADKNACIRKLFATTLSNLPLLTW